jgi:hypothetical protein
MDCAIWTENELGAEGSNESSNSRPLRLLIPALNPADHRLRDTGGERQGLLTHATRLPGHAKLNGQPHVIECVTNLGRELLVPGELFGKEILKSLASSHLQGLYHARHCRSATQGVRLKRTRW